MSEQTFVFMGRSGCGKGTQAKLLEEHLKKNNSDNPIYYLETGQGFRDFIKENNYTSQLSKKIYDAGALQPSFLAIWMWSHLLVENFKGNEHLIIDGTPRTYEEALVFLSALKFYGRKPTVVYLNVSRKWSEERLAARGRFDDILASDVKKRLDWFDTDVFPAVEYFRQSLDCNFIDIDGERTVDEIQADLLSRISA